MKKQKDRCAGFTLIEVIVALVLLGIAGAMMVTLIALINSNQQT